MFIECIWLFLYFLTITDRPIIADDNLINFLIQKDVILYKKVGVIILLYIYIEVVT